uniref:CSON003719 protein n=1 Tax=Culicoides sonorensis TaxID=179676 RepID=A0A336LD87_CULSO
MLKLAFLLLFIGALASFGYSDAKVFKLKGRSTLCPKTKCTCEPLPRYYDGCKKKGDFPVGTLLVPRKCVKGKRQDETWLQATFPPPPHTHYGHAIITYVGFEGRFLFIVFAVLAMVFLTATVVDAEKCPPGELPPGTNCECVRGARIHNHYCLCYAGNKEPLNNACPVY